MCLVKNVICWWNRFPSKLFRGRSVGQQNIVVFIAQGCVNFGSFRRWSRERFRVWLGVVFGAVAGQPFRQLFFEEFLHEASIWVSLGVLLWIKWTISSVALSPSLGGWWWIETHPIEQIYVFEHQFDIVDKRLNVFVLIRIDWIQFGSNHLQRHWTARKKIKISFHLKNSRKKNQLTFEWFRSRRRSTLVRDLWWADSRHIGNTIPSRFAVGVSSRTVSDHCYAYHQRMRLQKRKRKRRSD